MEDLTVKALNSMVEKILKDNQEKIAEDLFCGSTDDMTIGELFSLTTMNCLSLAMKLSVKLTLDLLQATGQIDGDVIKELFARHLSD